MSDFVCHMVVFVNVWVNTQLMYAIVVQLLRAIQMLIEPLYDGHFCVHSNAS